MQKTHKRWIILLSAVLLFIVLSILPLGLSNQAQMTIAIIGFALVLWISEVIPLHATALAVALFLIIFGRFPADKVFAQFFDKVVVLVFGGFVLAIAMHKHRLDEYLAHKLLGKFGVSSSMVLLGVLTATAFLSMWMSNSAAAAIAMPIALFILAKNRMRPVKSQFGKALILAVAYGATIGGIGTLIGSTPNVIAQKFLTEHNITFGFLEWGLRGFPFMVLMILISWYILLKMFPSERRFLKMQKHVHPFTTKQIQVATILLLTVLLWITEGLHGFHSSVIALVPVVLLSVFNLIDTKDIHKIGWDSLILIGGGIALGMAIDISGLDDSISHLLGTSLLSQHYFIVLLVMGFIGIILTSFLSNTAASAVFIPIITALATVLNTDMTNLVVAASIGVSLDFILPMGTPPTAMAHATGYVHIKDLLKAGLLISLAGGLLMAILAYFTWVLF